MLRLRHQCILIAALIAGSTFAASASKLDLAYQAYASGDKARAGAEYKRLANAGNALAEYNYAMMLKKGEIAGDKGVWLSWLEKAANSGVMNAAYDMGLAYENGEGVLRSQNEATRWFRVAAEKGHIPAAVSLGTQYFLGRGAPHDEKEAAHWYELAAQGGDIGAQYLIASMYEHGYGVNPDRVQAIMWYASAARQGDKAAKAKAEALARTKP